MEMADRQAEIDLNNIIAYKKSIWAEIKRIEDGIRVEREIVKVLGLLIVRDPDQGSVYRDEIAVSEANIFSWYEGLFLRMRDIELIDKDIAEQKISLSRSPPP